MEAEISTFPQAPSLLDKVETFEFKVEDNCLCGMCVAARALIGAPNPADYEKIVMWVEEHEFVQKMEEAVRKSGEDRL